MLLAEDKAEYDKYVQAIEAEQTRTPRAYRFEPIPFDQWRSYTDTSIANSVVRGGVASNKALLVKVRQDEANEAEQQRNAAREAVIAGKPDPAWKTPADAIGLKLSQDQEKTFVREQAELFCDANPDFMKSKSNLNNILAYVWAQGVSIPTRQCLELAHKRLRELGLIEERPAVEPEPEPAPVQEPIETPADYVIDGFDPETGEPRKFTQREIWRMDSATYRKAFKAWGENKPRFTRGYYA